MSHKTNLLKLIIAILTLPGIALGVLQCVSNNDKPNVVLITVDTLRDDHLGYNGYLRNTSPNIDMLAREGIVFKNSYSQAGWTLPSFATIFTSLYPKDHLITDWEIKLDDKLVTLPEVLADNGYHTYGYPCLFAFDSSSGFEQGFEYYRLDVVHTGEFHERYTSPEVNAMVLGDIEDGLKEPFFLWIHYFDPHVRYLPHPEYRFGDSPKDLYDGEVAFTDWHIGEILESLKEHRQYDNSIIILTADHGEEFMDHGRTSHRTLYQEVIKTPLIIKVPGMSNDLVDRYVSQIDIAPTILNLCELPVPGSWKGRNALAENAVEVPVYAERGGGEVVFQLAVIDNNMKLYEVIDIYADTSSARYKVETFYENENHLFDLKTDPLERRELYGKMEYSRQLKTLHNLFGEFYEGDSSRLKGQIELSEETSRKLKGLGYME
ncbi:MAG: sulfatase-like hydrolase/transferase [candidate division Zixibacteria bacterium]|nr:sulfatase-like hydrolase/transferase [candidate division Zixibacteria bacterium]